MVVAHLQKVDEGHDEEQGEQSREEKGQEPSHH